MIKHNQVFLCSEKVVGVHFVEKQIKLSLTITQYSFLHSYPFLNANNEYKGYINVFVGDVLYGDRLDDTLTNRNVSEVCGGASIVRDDHQLWSDGWAVNVHVQGVVNTENMCELQYCVTQVKITPC